MLSSHGAFSVELEGLEIQSLQESCSWPANVSSVRPALVATGLLQGIFVMLVLRLLLLPQTLFLILHFQNKQVLRHLWKCLSQLHCSGQDLCKATSIQSEHQGIG